MIERLYITRGDNLSNRACGIKTTEGILWLDDEFEYDWELSELLQRILGSSAMLLDKCLRLNNQSIPITRLAKHHDDIFCSSSMYVKKAIRTSSGKLWHTFSEMMEFFKDKCC